MIIIFYFVTNKQLVGRPCRYPPPHENVPLDLASIAESCLTNADSPFLEFLSHALVARGQEPSLLPHLFIYPFVTGMDI